MRFQKFPEQAPSPVRLDLRDSLEVQGDPNKDILRCMRANQRIKK
jgi:hypothetical protein